MSWPNPTQPTQPNPSMPTMKHQWTRQWTFSLHPYPLSFFILYQKDKLVVVVFSNTDACVSFAVTSFFYRSTVPTFSAFPGRDIPPAELTLQGLLSATWSFINRWSAPCRLGISVRLNNWLHYGRWTAELTIDDFRYSWRLRLKTTVGWRTNELTVPIPISNWTFYGQGVTTRTRLAIYKWWVVCRVSIGDWLYTNWRLRLTIYNVRYADWDYGWRTEGRKDRPTNWRYDPDFRSNNLRVRTYNMIGDLNVKLSVECR